MPVSALSSRIASEIVQLISAGDLAPDAHLSTQKLADRFQVSRSPVREALQILAERGVLEQRTNRGFFVGKNAPPTRAEGDLALPNDGPDAYYDLAEDWLRDAVPSEVTEQNLRERYDVTKSQLIAVLNRATREGWVERKRGYGWRLLPVAKTPEALEQIYRFRSVVEPAALLEPTFELDRAVIAAQRRIQQSLLDGGIERLPAERLLIAGARFHEELIKLSRNPFFVQSLERVNRLRRLIEYRSLVDRQRFYIQCAEHVEILELVQRGKNLEASSVMRRHLSGAIARKSPIQRSLVEQLHELDRRGGTRLDQKVRSPRIGSQHIGPKR